MARNGRNKPTLGDALAAIAGQPATTLAHLGALDLGNRMTLLKEANAGTLPGAFRVGKTFRVATAPWRTLLNIEPTPELARFMSSATAEPAAVQHEAA